MTKEELLISEIKGYIESGAWKYEACYLTKEDLEVIVKALAASPCDDCISRQAALDTFGLSEKSRKYGGDHSGYDTIMLYEVQDALEALPPVIPQSKQEVNNETPG